MSKLNGFYVSTETVLGTSMNVQKGENMHYMKALTE